MQKLARTITTIGKTEVAEVDGNLTKAAGTKKKTTTETTGAMKITGTETKPKAETVVSEAPKTEISGVENPSKGGNASRYLLLSRHVQELLYLTP
jgi:hypothetical protein